ncbi:MAG: DegV family protein [Clostridia bacterium]|nr:DegV family protein [Clostridia bacterium]
MVRIIIDSTTDVIEEIKARLTIVPLTINFGDEEFIDGVTINHKTFYEKLVESDVLPTTSQAAPDAFDRVFKETVEAGDDAVVITLSSKLSGTYQSAIIAAAEYEGRIFVVDGNSVAIGTGILAELALKYADGGMSASDIADRIKAERDNVRLIAMLDTLEYLKRGGRISKTAAFAGGILSIKPVVCIEDGEIKVLGKARGSKQGNNLLIKEIQTSGGVDFTKPVLLGYTGMTDVLLRKYIEDSSALWEGHIEELNCTIVGSVVGTHAGPGAVAAAFFKK